MIANRPDTAAALTTVPERPGTRVRRRRLRGPGRKLAPYLFIAPFFLLYGAFLLGPTVYAAYLSVRSWDGITPSKWVGFNNFTNLMHDPAFIEAARNTLIYSAAGVFILCPLAFVLALMLNSKGIRFKDFFRVVFFIPIVVSPLVISVIFVLIFDRNIGLANAVLHGALGFPQIGWIDRPGWAKVSIIIVVLWRYTGYIMIFFLAGLQNVPRDLRECAQVFGASYLQELRYVVIPLLRPVTAFIIIVVLIGTAQIFEEPYVLTQGGPGNASLSVAEFVYRDGFQRSQLGYAAAASVVLFIAIFIPTMILMKLFKVGREDT